MWDGVDRGNGAEKRYFNMVNTKKDKAAKAHEYSTLDLWRSCSFAKKLKKGDGRNRKCENKNICNIFCFFFFFFVVWN